VAIDSSARTVRELFSREHSLVVPILEQIYDQPKRAMPLPDGKLRGYLYTFNVLYVDQSGLNES
jgi:hypothetical protein